MLAFRAALAAMACVLAADLAALENVVLGEAQVKALGLATVRAEAAAAAGTGGLPARVVVPNEQMRVVAAPVSGMVEFLAVAPGQSVRRGQVVARLASKEALELQRDALQAASQAQLAEQNRKRDEQLYAEGLIAESRLQSSRAGAVQALAQASERRQGLELAGAVSGKVGGALALLAPIDGVVLEQGAQVGQRVEPATLIYRIARLTPLWLEIQAPMALAAGLAKGTAVQVVGGPARGKLIAVGGAVEAGSQSVTLRAAVDSRADSLRPGQAVEVELLVPAPAGLRLPSGALFRQGGETLVFVLAGNDAGGQVFRPQPVKVLAPAGDGVMVEGVRAGDAVVVKGVSALKAVWTGVGKE